MRTSKSNKISVNNKISANKPKYKINKTKKALQLDRGRPDETYLSLFQTPQSFEEVAQVTTHAVEIRVVL